HLIVWLALRARHHPLAPLSWIMGATVWLLVFDIATGGRLQISSVLGYSLHTAARFFGIGNPAFAVLGACAVLVGCTHVQYAPRRREAVLAVACFFAIVVLTDGAPSLGDDVGGILTLVPVFALALIVLSGRRISWKKVIAAGFAAVLVLAAVVGIDYLRPASDRTHIATYFGGGSSDQLTTIARKLSTNARVFTASIWTWTVPIIAIFSLYLLVWEGRAKELLPRNSPVRAGVVGALGVGLLG